MCLCVCAHVYVITKLQEVSASCEVLSPHTRGDVSTAVHLVETQRQQKVGSEPALDISLWNLGKITVRKSGKIGRR